MLQRLGGQSNGSRSRSEDQLSQIRDLDYADAITTLNIQLAGLQAAQQSYAKISNLNLFNYL